MSDVLIDMRLIDLILTHHAEMELQVRVLESALLNETTLADIVLDPKGVWREVLLTPGIGEKARHNLARVVCQSLACTYPREWGDAVLSSDSGAEARLPGLTLQLRRVQTIWKVPNLNRSHPRKVMCFATRRKRAGYG